jgi:hypothetical protein
LLHVRKPQKRVQENRAAGESAERNRSALAITDTELKLIAAAAIIGDSSRPKAG